MTEYKSGHIGRIFYGKNDMEKYKITSVIPQTHLGVVDIRMQDDNHFRTSARMPIEFMDTLAVGKSITMHQNHRGNAVAFAVGGRIHCIEHPTDRDTTKRFLRTLHGVRNGTLDRVLFKWALMRGVWHAGHRPRWSTTANFQLLSRQH